MCSNINGEDSNMNYYIMSDIHGCYDAFLNALNNWNKDKEHLVLMGDYIDRGPDSLKVVKKIMSLKKEYGNKVAVLKGNHEDMLTSWLFSPSELLGLYYNEHHNECLKSFLGKEKYKSLTRQGRAERMIHKFKEELHFLKNLELYKETESIIFVHAGLNLNGDWKKDETSLLWIREKFIYSSLTPEKRVFFGHTPTMTIHADVDENNRYNNFDIHISEDNMKIGVDGGVSMGGQLNCLKVNEKGEIIEKFIFKS